MNVTLRQLRAAVGVASHRSFRRAAEAAHVSQPALSLAISELEAELGVRLFDRTSRSVTPTELGNLFVQRSAQVLTDLDQLIQEVTDVVQSRRGRVVVSCVSSIAGRIVPIALERCANRYPMVDVVVRDDVAIQVLAAVRARDADFGLTVAPAEPGEGLCFEPLYEDRFHVVVPKRHRFAKRAAVAWRDLHGEPLIALSTSSGMHRTVSDELLRQQVVPARTTPVSHLSTVHSMLEASYGIAILPVIALPVARHPLLVARPLVEPALGRTIGVYRRSDRSPSPAAAAFLEIVRCVLMELADRSVVTLQPAP